MGSKYSKAQRPTFTWFRAATIPALPKVPQEIVDEILDLLAADSDLKSIRSCSLVSKSWVPSCRRHLFRTIVFNPRNVNKWLKKFPVPEESPARHVRDLRFPLGGDYGAPEEFFEYTPWFTNVEKMTLMHGEFLPLWIPPFVRLPQSVTSLAIVTDTIALVEIRNVMVQLPNLNDLSLSGSLDQADKDIVSGMGAVLRGRFGGRLRLLREIAGADVTNMLLEAPAGLSFTEVEIRATHECLLSTVKLAEACGRNLVKLSYAVSVHDGHESFERSFDCSKFPNLQEVSFGVGWMGGSLLWIPMALASLKPSTSPHLSAIQLKFAGSSSTARSPGTLIKEKGDLQRVVDEVVRIKREFEGVANLTVVRDSWFKEIMDTLNIHVQWDR